MCVVDTLTTIGWSFCASVTKSGDLLVVALLPANDAPASALPVEQLNPVLARKNSMKTVMAFMALRIFLPSAG
jgi:hypothetical protein